MESFTPHIYTFILPLFVGNVVHMLIVKGNYFQFSAQPLSAALFGYSKTYRAFLVMPLMCGLSSLLFRSVLLQEPNYGWSFSLGFILGFSYLIAELPNSFVKRKLGIQAGQHSSKYRLAQYIIDKSDSLLISCLVYYFISGITVRITIILFVVSFIIHVSFSWLLVLLRIKKSF